LSVTPGRASQSCRQKSLLDGLPVAPEQPGHAADGEDNQPDHDAPSIMGRGHAWSGHERNSCGVVRAVFKHVDQDAAVRDLRKKTVLNPLIEPD
jgi:hypothetical protein